MIIYEPVHRFDCFTTQIWSQKLGQKPPGGQQFGRGLTGAPRDQGSLASTNTLFYLGFGQHSEGNGHFLQFS